MAPWVQDALVEQDLVISRALVDIYARPNLAKSLAFRGGTALYKLYLPPTRYSEDIDLVQTAAGPIGPVIDGLRAALAWLGEPTRKQGEGRVTLLFKFLSEDVSPRPLKLKVEINTREHFAVDGYRTVAFSVENRWLSGSASILTFSLNELLATKLRALYQRKKGRDLLDLAVAFPRVPSLDASRIAQCFTRYMAEGGVSASREELARNLAEKLDDPAFTSDIEPLLAPITPSAWDGDAAWDGAFQFDATGLRFDAHAAARQLHQCLLTHLR